MIEEDIQEAIHHGYVITLVHGTFAAKARWIQRDSEFRKLIAKALPQAVIFRPFVWSGENSESARQEAVQALRKHLHIEAARNNGAKHLIIAHSHGGNIATQAVREMELATEVLGIICLSVPFVDINTRLRSYEHLKDFNSYEKIFYLFSIAWLFIAAASLPMFLALIMHPGQDDTPFILTAMATLALGVFLAGLFIVRGVRAANRLCEPYRDKRATCTKLMILRSVGDEATGLLTAAAFSSWIMRQVHRVLCWPVTLHLRKRRLISGWLLVYFAIFFLPSFLLVGPLAVIASVCMLPFGFDLAVLSLWLDISVEAAPVGSGTWYIDTMPTLSYDSLKGLRHSAIYDDPRTVSRIIEWMTAQ